MYLVLFVYEVLSWKPGISLSLCHHLSNIVLDITNFYLCFFSNLLLENSNFFHIQSNRSSFVNFYILHGGGEENRVSSLWIIMAARTTSSAGERRADNTKKKLHDPTEYQDTMNENSRCVTIGDGSMNDAVILCISSCSIRTLIW